MGKRKPAAVEAVQVPPRIAETAPPPSAEQAPPERERRPYPAVAEQKEVLISPRGDKLRLLRSSRFK